ncbi:MAG: GIY-YIG nuclease family protein [Flavobacterium sp.]
MEDEYITMSEDECSSDDLTNYTMYKIMPKNPELKLCYVGHTAYFHKRIAQHKEQAINEDYAKSHQKLYTTIRQHGGWDAWDMVELEQFQAGSKLEARIREQELIDEHEANLNSLKAYISPEDLKALKKQITDNYRKGNKAHIREMERKYKQEHKEVIDEQMKTYRAKNKDKIREKSREYCEKNKEKVKEWARVWRENHKEELKEKRKLYEAKKKQKKLAESQKIETTDGV